MEYLWIFGPAVLLGLIALIITYQFVDPAPPDRITIATGGPQGAYYAFAQRYREILARPIVPYLHRRVAPVHGPDGTGDEGRHVAKEGIRVNAVCPGFIHTALTRGDTD